MRSVRVICCARCFCGYGDTISSCVSTGVKLTAQMPSLPHAIVAGCGSLARQPVDYDWPHDPTNMTASSSDGCTNEGQQAKRNMLAVPELIKHTSHDMFCLICCYPLATCAFVQTDMHPRDSTLRAYLLPCHCQMHSKRG